jgi:GT2 family glycosyltransferase
MNTKTAAIILNHNLPEYTDMLFESLKPYERNDYELMVFDNGSSKDGQSKYTTHGIEKNVYFGGGFNAAMQMVIDNPTYDSMLFLNNDLTIHPYNFVRILRAEMFGFTFNRKEDPENYQKNPQCDLISPSFYNVEPNKQCHWKTMHGYGQVTREVPFIDFQCPLISKRLLEEVKEIHPSLIMGFGIDFLFALTCQDKGWKIKVSDLVGIIHHNSMTVKKGVAGINIQEYCQRAEAGQYEFFHNIIKRSKDYLELRNKAENYQFP